MPLAKPERRRKKPSPIVLRVRNWGATRGHLQFGELRLPCTIGRSGIKAVKREGDGATPRGEFRLRRVLVRSDKIQSLRTGLACCAIRNTDGWCDAPSDRNYNKPVTLPYSASAERLWRSDRLYDIVVVLGYNDGPRIRERGSAIFLHIARGSFEPTEGCVAVRLNDMRRLLARIGKHCEIVIGS